MAILLWFAGLLGLGAAALVVSAKGRAAPTDVAGRGPILVTAAAFAGLVAASVWTWGGAAATHARADRLAGGALVHLQLRGVASTVTDDDALFTRGLPPGTPHVLVAHAGDVLRLGGAGDAIPGLTSWVLPAAAGTATVLAVPADPTSCAAWATDASTHATARDGSCRVVAGAFTLDALPLVPDAAAVIGRAERAALAIGVPPLVLLLAVAFARRRDRRTRTFARALRIALLGAGLAALVLWRLFWAYRIDVLRDLAPHGARLTANQFDAAAIGAALAGVAMLAPEAIAALSAAKRAALATLAWAAYLAAATALTGRLAVPTRAQEVVAALSFAGALAPVLVPLGARLTRHFGPGIALAAIAAGALAGRVVAPRAALAKLGLAYAFVLAAHAALQVALARETRMRDRVAAIVMICVALGALARFDAGVTLAIGGAGLALAMLVAGHDAAYGAGEAARIGVLEREHARLLAAHGAAALAIAAGIAGTAMLASDSSLVADGAPLAIHAPLAAAALFLLAALIARTNRRRWVPWLAAAVAAVGIWCARDVIVDRATGGSSVGANRIAAVLEPGYALLKDDRAFAKNASAWREAALPRAATDDAAPQGYFGARIRDVGVSRSIDNDYFPVLVARELGIPGLVQTLALLFALAIGGGALANLRLRHGSRAHRARWLVTAVAGALAVYQPLASLGVLPLTGISWPGFGIDSPGDLWLFVLGGIWVFACEPEADAIDDERVRQTARLRRARAVALTALAAVAVCGAIVIARAGSAALTRGAHDDARVDAALAYASSVACTPDGTDIGGEPTDAETGRFDRDLRAAWARDRAAVHASLAACADPPHGWTVAKTGDACEARFDAGLPTIHVTADACRVSLADDVVAVVRAPTPLARAQRIRVVSEAMGKAADDVGELVAGPRVVRLRAGAPTVQLASLTSLAPASRVELPGGAALAVQPNPRGVALTGDADVFVTDPQTGWRRVAHGPTLLLDRESLVIAGPPTARTIALFRPPRAWAGSAPSIDPLLADDTTTVGDRPRRAYPYAQALPELGWVNPYDVGRSLGLDGWIHAAVAHPADARSCGTLEPPAVARDKVCTPNPLDGVLECRVALQPELDAALAQIAAQLARDPKPLTGRSSIPTRVAYVALRGDTGELLAQGSQVTGREPLAYAPADADAEARLVSLRESRGESDAERVEWNLPIAVGSTFKPVVARAAEEAFPAELAGLTLTAAGHAEGCRAHRGKAVAPMLGHCPPTSLEGTPTTADVHDYLAHSLNWYQAALGVLGLGLGGTGHFEVKGTAVTLGDIAASDLASWPADAPLQISDAGGPILSGHNVNVAALRRTPLWQHVEALLGRPLCTLGSRAACEAAANRADVCAARALPIAQPSRDLRYLVALGPDRLDVYPDDRPGQQTVPVREYFQLLRGSGVHAVGSLAQLADAFGRVIYDPAPAPKLAASWFPAPSVGTLPAWSCANASGRAAAVRGADGGLCAVVQEAGTAHAHVAALLADPKLVVYGAKTGTTDSLADLARKPAACRAWNEHHAAAAHLECGKVPPDDSLFVIAFGVVTPKGTIPITLALQLQRAGTGAAAHASPAFVRAVESYFVQ
ncbi:MAG TPA: hypothetical protein VGM88_08595 [Kofleriaceae bacterium]